MSQKEVKNLPPSVQKIVEFLKADNPEIAASVLKSRARELQENWTGWGAATHALKSEPIKKVINTTGILLHTNLGRAPLGNQLLEKVFKKMNGYSNLELDLNTGKRGSRTSYLDAVVESLIPHYSPIWVNNNAAGVLLVLSTIKKATTLQSVILSRGELVEIGGGFRIPEIMKESGFNILEVGTTNRTRLSDYEMAVSKEPAVIGCVHPSNFVIEGFTESVNPMDLIPLAQKRSVPLFYDVGSMSFQELIRIPKGFDFVMLSTDKTLGGPQGGLILARKPWDRKLKENPLYRAFRLDKLSLALLEEVFGAYSNKTDRALVPISQMLALTRNELESRLRVISSMVFKNLKIMKTRASMSFGGGSWPGESWESAALELTSPLLSTQEITHLLRTGEPALLTTIRDEKVLMCLQTILNEDWDHFVLAIKRLDEKLNRLKNSERTHARPKSETTQASIETDRSRP
ncbi:MAG: L-seryl-tRNA(Sec) selenium transferase [Oligoflexia bacterium]|nr:L-seryl-tRNA(Sec) selenium transferase [Oligoflexia bacterium]